MLVGEFSVFEQTMAEAAGAASNSSKAVADKGVTMLEEVDVTSDCDNKVGGC